MTSVPMTSAWSRRPTLSDWTRARAVRSAHGTPGLHVPRCDPRASLLPLNLSLSPTNLPFFFCHLLIVSTVSASPHTSVYVKHSNIFIYSFLVQLVLLPRSEVFVVPHYKNCIFSHLLLVVCSFWFYVPTFHTSSTQCCQIWLTPNSPERTSNLLFSTGVLFLNNRHTHTHMVLGKRCKFNLFILWSLNCLCCLFKAFSLFLYVEILKKRVKWRVK